MLCLTTVVFGLIACGDDFDSGKNISIVAREDGSGTKSAFMEIIGLKGQKDPVNVIIQTGTAGVLAEVNSNTQAIAYESLGYVDDTVKMLKIDGVEATSENIINGTYKIARPLSIVYKESSIQSGLNKEFYNFLMSADAQSLISDGYVSIRSEAGQYSKVQGLSGTINVSGSTSLQPLMVKLAEKFKSYYPNVTVNVGGGGSGTGYGNANNGTSDFGMISEEFNQSKATDCTHSIVAKDGIAVIVNKSNTIENLTMAQLKNIYNRETTQPYTKWSDVK